MGRFRNLCDNETHMEAFRRRYEVPDDVNLALALPGTDTHDQTEGRIHVPLLAVVEGGVRFPLHPLLVEIYNICRLSPLQLCPNFYRVVMGVVALNRLLGTNLGWYDIRRLYSVCPTTHGTYYLKIWDKERRLVTDLPNSCCGENDDFFIVTGNFLPEMRVATSWGLLVPILLDEHVGFHLFCLLSISLF